VECEDTGLRVVTCAGLRTGRGVRHTQSFGIFGS